MRTNTFLCTFLLIALGYNFHSICFSTQYNFINLWQKLEWPIRHVGNACLMRGPIKCGYFNAAWCIKSENELNEAKLFFGDHRFYIQHSPGECLADISSSFKDPVTRLEMMLAISSFQSKQKNRKFLIKKVENEKELKDFASLFAPVFSLSVDESLHALKPMSEVSTFFVAYMNEMPIGRAQLFIDDTKTAGIWMVFVKEEFRRQGIGRALTEECILFAKEGGCAYAVLNATPQAEYLYVQMGFSPKELWHLEIMR